MSPSPMRVGSRPIRVEVRHDPAAPVRLRPHHLLCLLTYAGKGYSEAFTAGLDGIVQRLAQGAAIELVDGPDDVCAPLRHEPSAHCHGDSVRQRDRRAAADLQALWPLPLRAGLTLALDDASLHAARQAFAQGRTRSACVGCEWHALCTGIAADGFSVARLQPSRGAGQPAAPD